MYMILALGLLSFTTCFSAEAESTKKSTNFYKITLEAEGIQRQIGKNISQVSTVVEFDPTALRMTLNASIAKSIVSSAVESTSIVLYYDRVHY